MDLNEAVIARTRRVPLPEAVPGDGPAVTRQLDAALVPRAPGTTSGTTRTSWTPISASGSQGSLAAALGPDGAVTDARLAGHAGRSSRVR